MKHARQFLRLGIAYIFLTLVSPVLAQNDVVHAVIFYSPSCPHCHQVISEDLPHLLEEYGDQLDIIALNTAHPVGQELYQAAVQQFSIPLERQGVPTLIIGDNVLVGSLEIPQQLPALIEAHLEQGGIGWPAIPGLVEVLQSAEPTPKPATPTVAAPTRRASSTPTAVVPTRTVTVPEAEPTTSPTPTQQVVTAAEQAGSSAEPRGVRDITGNAPDSALDRFRRDVRGNSLSLLVLLGMVGVTVTVTLRLKKSSSVSSSHPRSGDRKQWDVLALILLGLGVSFYMAYVETTDTTAVCGPVGDCNTVQQSEYARLFGVAPIGLIGLLGYAALGTLWVLRYRGRGRSAQWARFLLPAMALIGTLFSIYLTFLEPFVIGGTCLWCLTSAVAITLILLLTADGGQAAVVEFLANGERRQWLGS